jgi:septum formation protein
MTIWCGKQPLILASQSAARKTLLYNAGISFEALPADIDERAIQKASGLTAPGEIASLLAERKAAYVSLRHPGRYVVGADQTLARGAQLFSKQAAPRPRSNCARSPGRPTNCIRRSPSSATVLRCSAKYRSRT